MTMITDAPINRLPSGLLGMVDVKAMGKNPSRLGDVVIPELDITPFYQASDRQKFISTPVAIGAAGFFPTNLVVPQNKAWVIEAVWVIIDTPIPGGTTKVAFTPVMIYNNVTIWSGNPGPTFDAGDLGSLVGFHFPRPFVALPGYTMGIICNRMGGTGGGNYTFNAALTVVDI